MRRRAGPGFDILGTVALQLSLFDSSPDLPAGPPAGEVLVTRGARAAEALLLDRLDRLAAEAARDPALLTRPVRVVVPSRSLRAHAGAAIVRARGRSVAGVVIQTLYGLAFEVLERAGETAPPGLRLADVLARRRARDEPSLRQGLEELVDGYGAVAGSVRDLLDAGLEPALAEGVLESLAVDGRFAGTRSEVERASALVRVAARVERDLERLKLGRVSTLLRRAVELLEADPEGVLPARAVLVHGFADATGVATDLLQSLLRRRRATLILDRPPVPHGDGTEHAFTERLADRLAAVARAEEPPPPPLADIPPPRVERFQAVGAEAETREIARRARALIDGGARPEGIAVVARDFRPYRLPLARHLRRLGVPFSALGTRGGVGPAARRARAFLELLERGEDAASDRWLDALGNLRGLPGRLADLRLAFYALGAGRLRDVVELRPDTFLGEHDSYALPIRQGLRAQAREDAEEAETDAEAAEGEVRAVRRRVEGKWIREAVRIAGRVRERLAGWPEEATASVHLARLRALLGEDLAWRKDSEASAPVFEALDELEREIPPRFKLTLAELRLLLDRELEEAGTGELGGRGGGVQVLTVTEARGRTFEHLFVAGLNRDLFPRVVREDPLLPDDLRLLLQRMLPDVPVKRGGFDEERYLYAQLLSASPAVTLSWRIADDEGKPLSPSPLLGETGEVRMAPALYSRSEATDRHIRPAAERAVLAALHGSRRELAGVLPAALAESCAPGRADVLAAARLAVLDELDPDLRTPEGRAVRASLGPYYGFVGAMPALGTDPRRMDLYVTQLEALASCPWQLFLRRLLRLEPTPDPLQMLPGADPLLLGNVVHGVLEEIAKAAGAGKTGTAVAVPWPAAAELDRMLAEVSVRLLAEEGIFLPAMARALAEQARPRLEAAREADWADGTVPVLRLEEEGGLTVLDAQGRPRAVRFRADRVDRLEDGRLRWTDYKTGRPISTSKREARRREQFLEGVRKGKYLQGVAYLLASEGEAVGRYLYLKPGLEDRAFEVTGADQDLAEAFAASSAAVLGAWDAGSFFPRLVETNGRKEPNACRFCDVAEACLRGDSGVRMRLFEWTETADTADAAEEALLKVWRLADGQPGNGEAE